jgi:hypothetical protein
MNTKTTPIVISIALLIFAQNMFSATKTWTGNGVDNKLTTAANWVENAPAAVGDDLIFPAVANQYSVNNDILMFPGNGNNFRTITVQGGGYAFGGTNSYNLSNGITVNGGNQSLGSCAIFGTVFVDSGASLSLTFLSMRYSGFTIDGPGNLTIAVAPGLTANSYTKNGTGTTNFNWGSANISQITVNSGKFIGQGVVLGGIQGLNILQVTGGIVEGFFGANVATFNGPNTEFKPSALNLWTMNLNIINGAKFSPGVCSAFPTSPQPLYNTLNLTNAVFNFQFSNCTANINNLIHNGGLNNGLPLVTGFFTGYPEGSTLTIGGKVYHLTYRGGDGNDVQLIGSTKPFDFDGDGKTDVSIFRPTLGQWWYLQSSDNSSRTLQFGVATDKIVPADYTGDGKTDIAVYRPSTGEWFILRSEDLSYYAFPFGISTDTPVPADYDGDGRSDPAVYRSSNSTFYILKSTGGIQITPFGLTGDRAVPADYDGDGKADIAIYRSSGGLGQWWINKSSDGSVITAFAGFSNAPLMPADFTGDGKADFAYFVGASTTWNYVKSEDSSSFSVQFGQVGDILAPGDYDGDGKSDLASFRPSTNTWNIRRSSDGVLFQPTFGTNGDIAVPSAFIR